MHHKITSSFDQRYDDDDAAADDDDDDDDDDDGGGDDDDEQYAVVITTSLICLSIVQSALVVFFHCILKFLLHSALLDDIILHSVVLFLSRNSPTNLGRTGHFRHLDGQSRSK